jgi:pimeloyl-ACP methyl ester carboxylesterase
LLRDPASLQAFLETAPAMWAHGVQGYTDDRLADGPGWGSFDVASIQCPVGVIHGGSDSIVPPAHAYHTAAIVPNARLRIHDSDGHLSVIQHVIPALAELLAES